MTLGRALYVSFENARTLAFAYGQFRTAARRRSLDRLGNEIPWYTYPAIEYIDNHRLQGLTVLEYGSGYSSLYYAGRGAEVTSVEDDGKWFNELSRREAKRAAPRFRCVLAESKRAYVERPEVTGADIVVIDGSYRSECCEYVASMIGAGECNAAWIVIDNSDWYPDSIKTLDAALGWPRADFCGFGPINPYTSVTSICLNPKRILKREGGISSVRSIRANREGTER